MTRHVLVSGGTAEWHLLVHARPEIEKKKRPIYPEGTEEFALSDDTVPDRLQLALKSKPERLLVIFDAEAHPAQVAWEKIRPPLQQAGYKDLPEDMDPSGVVSEVNRDRRVGVWIMPDNVSPGMIEDFYLKSIPDVNREMVRAKGFVDGIPEVERLFGKKVSKASLGVWLAIQEDPMSPGQSISRNLIQRDAGLLPAFGAWLDRLFAD